MDRGRIGTMPAAAQLDDESNLDFLEGLRAFTYRRVEPLMRQQAEAAFQDQRDRTGGTPEAIVEIRDAIDHLPIVATRNRLLRSAQEMHWDGVFAAYRPAEAELLAELDRADRSGPGSVQWDPAFRYPEYYEGVEYHLVPGGLNSDPLAGYHYHISTKWLFTGDNDHDQLHRAFIARTPAPDLVERVLDLGCSSGQSTTALKERFPGAEVWGIDIAAGMVRYAHKRAIDLGLDVHFKQAPAEDTGLPGGSFDLIYAYILFHEIPVAISERVVAEVYRLLRPGGRFVVIDFQNVTPQTTPLQRYNRDFIQYHNAEPYSGEFIHCNFSGMLQRAGFRIVEDEPARVHISWLWAAEK